MRADQATLAFALPFALALSAGIYQCLTKRMTSRSQREVAGSRKGLVSSSAGERVGLLVDSQRNASHDLDVEQVYVPARWSFEWLTMTDGPNDPVLTTTNTKLKTDQARYEMLEMPEWKALEGALKGETFTVLYGNPEATYKNLIEPYVCCGTNQEQPGKLPQVTERTTVERTLGNMWPESLEKGCVAPTPSTCFMYGAIHKTSETAAKLLEERLGYKKLYTTENPPDKGTSYNDLPRNKLPAYYGVKMLGPSYIGKDIMVPKGFVHDSSLTTSLAYMKTRAQLQRDPQEFKPRTDLKEKAPNKIETFLEHDQTGQPQSYGSYHYTKGELEVSKDVTKSTSETPLPGFDTWRTFKYGRGHGFYDYGTNNCINAIVTRFDKHGNLQMMTMMRPKNSDSDPGEFQLSSGSIFVTPWWSIVDPDGFSEQNADTLRRDDNYFNIIQEDLIAEMKDQKWEPEKETDKFPGLQRTKAKDGTWGPWVLDVAWLAENRESDPVKIPGLTVTKDGRWALALPAMDVENLWIGEGDEPANQFTRNQHTPPTVTRDNVDENGKLSGKAASWARRAIYEKVFHGTGWRRGTVGWNGGLNTPSTDPKDIKADNDEATEVWKQVKNWDFYKIRAGVVDDTRTTDEAWVETAYVVHHMTGAEDNLELFSHGSSPANRQNVLLASWRDIDSKSSGEGKTMQYINTPTEGGQFNIKEIDVLQPYDAVQEFDIWHGEHSFVVENVAQFVRTHYAFNREIESSHNFGVSTPTAGLEDKTGFQYTINA